MKGVHTLAYTQNKDEEAIETAQDSGQSLPRPPWGTPQRGPGARSAPGAPRCSPTLGGSLPQSGGVCGCERWSQLRPGAASERGGGSHCWHSEVAHWVLSSICVGPGWPQPRVHSGPSSFSTAPFWGKNTGARRGYSTHLRENGAS